MISGHMQTIGLGHQLWQSLTLSQPLCGAGMTLACLHTLPHTLPHLHKLWVARTPSAQPQYPPLPPPTSAHPVLTS